MIWDVSWFKKKKRRKYPRFVPSPVRPLSDVKITYPWRVTDHYGRPRIVDAYGFVVADIISGGFSAANSIVEKCNAQNS